MPPSCDELPCLTSRSTEETAAELFFITEIILDLNSGAVVQPSAEKKKKKKTPLRFYYAAVCSHCLSEP